MNRPKIDDYVDLELKLTEEGVFNFVTDLISYCDELEKALDKACELLPCLDCLDCLYVCHINCDEVRKGEFSCTKEDWKEWLLKDE